MSDTSRMISAETRSEDVAQHSLRPQSLQDFTGQREVCENLSVFIQASKQRGNALDHTLFYGPPGLGKTTLAQIVAHELGVNFRPTSGPLLTRAGDLAALLTNLQQGDVLFIDEIHRLNIAVEEMLYSAMEDFKLDIMIGEGPSARSVRIDLAPFTLVGATTRLGLLSNPLRDRFGIPLRLRFYTVEELETVLARAAALLDTAISSSGLHEIASRARGTPRIAVRLLKRVCDFAIASNSSIIDQAFADYALTRLEVDNKGLDSADRRYLQYIADHYNGGPVGIDTLAAGLSEQRDAIEETIEPFLLQIGFIQRTPRGRCLSGTAFHHMGLEEPKENAKQPSLDTTE